MIVLGLLLRDRLYPLGAGITFPHEFVVLLILDSIGAVIMTVRGLLLRDRLDSTDAGLISILGLLLRDPLDSWISKDSSDRERGPDV